MNSFMLLMSLATTVGNPFPINPEATPSVVLIDGQPKVTPDLEVIIFEICDAEDYTKAMNTIMGRHAHTIGVPTALYVKGEMIMLERLRNMKDVETASLKQYKEKTGIIFNPEWCSK